MLFLLEIFGLALIALFAFFWTIGCAIIGIHLLERKLLARRLYLELDQELRLLIPPQA